MDTKAIVKVISRGKVICEKKFTGTNLEGTYMNYVRQQTNKGYECLVLKTIDDKEWYKMRFYPPEAI